MVCKAGKKVEHKFEIAARTLASLVTPHVHARADGYVIGADVHI